MPTPAALRTTEYFAISYRRTWRGSIISTFLGPVLYLAAMGIGLGRFVDHGHRATGALGGVDYLHFVAPALLAVTAMQTASTEATFPVIGAIKWNKSYSAMLATPLGVDDLLLGHLLWIGIRVLAGTTAYLAVMAAFSTASWGALAAVPAGLLTGMAFAAPLVAFSATQENDAVFNIIFRFVLVPLFLFSGTFFPLRQLPAGLRDVAYATPLWHGVDLCRSLTLGTADGLRTTGHVAYLTALTVVGYLAGRVAYRRRLRT